VTLLGGADGANPHHASSAERFCMLIGSAQLLTGDRLLVAGEGGLAVVPSNCPRVRRRAGSDADLLIVISPLSKDPSISAAWPGPPPASSRSSRS
jgi:hypothetical protein